MDEDYAKKIIEENFRNRESLLNNGVIIINSEFDENLMENVLFKMVDMENDKTIDSITIYINSNGGQVSSFFPIMDMISCISKPVRTIALGKAYSAGAFLLMCGDDRYAYKHSDILIHEVASSLGYNKNSQTQEEAKYLSRLNETISRIIRDKTKMTQQEIDKYMQSNMDIFITAKEALKYGIIDHII